jgi:hypothetical protein
MSTKGGQTPRQTEGYSVLDHVTCHSRYWVHVYLAADTTEQVPTAGHQMYRILRTTQLHYHNVYQGKGKGKGHPRTGHEGPEGE